MFDIEISRTWYLFSGPIYVSVYVTVSVTMIWYLRRFVCNHNVMEIEPNQVQNGTRWMAWSIHPFTSTVPILDTSDYSD